MAGRGMRAPYMSTLRGDLAEVTQLVFVYFLGTVVLWPFIIAISIIFIPLVSDGPILQR